MAFFGNFVDYQDYGGNPRKQPRSSIEFDPSPLHHTFLLGHARFIAQPIPALVLSYDLLEDRLINDVIINNSCLFIIEEHQWHSRQTARVPLFCSHHILTSCVICYWTYARQNGIYLLILLSFGQTLSPHLWAFLNNNFLLFLNNNSLKVIHQTLTTFSRKLRKLLQDNCLKIQPLQPLACLLLKRPNSVQNGFLKIVFSCMLH